MNSLHGFAFATLLSVCLGFAALGQAQSDAAIPEAHLTFTTIDVPGAVATDVFGINSAGDMVGGYSPESGNGSAFLLSEGTFSFFAYPGAVGINDSGIISGWAYVRQNTAAVSFLYEGKTFTKIRLPGQSATIARGINNAGYVVGGFGSFSATRGFELRGHQLKDISPPGAYIYVFGDGINNLGEVVGSTSGGVGANNGFACKGGTFLTISFPGANDLTEAWGVNDSGVIVGWYEKCSPCAFHGFAYKNGKYVSLDYPGAAATFAFGINNVGEVVGAYSLDNVTHGFVTSPITVADFK
jgi:uncharacterized membrane protein